MAEATLPKQPEAAQNPTASGPQNGRKSAFRRNPLLATSAIFKSQPLEASLDTSTANGISFLQAGSPEPPRGSECSIGDLVQSTRSIKKRLAFNPLAPLSENPESFPQTLTTSTAQTLTEETAPTEPKKKSLSPASAVKSTGRVEGEARQVEGEEQAAKPTIRWPSRYLDRMKQNKRKRWGEPAAVPSPDSGSYGLGETDPYRSYEEDGVTGQPGKIRRRGESREFTSQVAGDPNTARPYSEAAQKAVNTGEQPLPRTPIPIKNSTGTFKVPSPGDSDWSDSGSEEEEDNTGGLKDMKPSRTNNEEFALANPRLLQLKPPKPLQIPPLTRSEALQKAREKLQKHKPRNPSGLSHSSRAYPSPPALSETAYKGDSGRQAAEELEPSTAVDPEPTGRTNFTTYVNWCKTAPPAVTAALETMEVDSNIAGEAFARVLEDTGAGRTNRFTTFEEWSKTAPPAVTAVLENMQVDSNLAGQAFKFGLDNFTKLK